jgi:hypothetical protein
MKFLRCIKVSYNRFKAYLKYLGVFFGVFSLLMVLAVLLPVLSAVSKWHYKS